MVVMNGERRRGPVTRDNLTTPGRADSRARRFFLFLAEEDALVTGASDVISLPNGGGALAGIGEKFAPDLHTGTGNFTVPLAVPPGRNGLQPKLNLVYSTGAGNGPFGLGWSLSLPGVSRRTAKGVPRYDEDRDVYVLSGAEDLEPVEWDGAVTRYRPRTEGLFAQHPAPPRPGGQSLGGQEQGRTGHHLRHPRGIPR